MSRAYVVVYTPGPYFATGWGPNASMMGRAPWTDMASRAFVFTDVKSGVFKDARRWATEHSRELARRLPRNRRIDVTVWDAPLFR